MFLLPDDPACPEGGVGEQLLGAGAFVASRIGEGYRPFLELAQHQVSAVARGHLADGILQPQDLGRVVVTLVSTWERLMPILSSLDMHRGRSHMAGSLWKVVMVESLLMMSG